MNKENLKAALADEAFVKSLFELDTIEEVQAALRQKGVELTEEEILSFRELILKMESGEIAGEQLEQWAKQAEDGELPDEVLEQVSGGSAMAVGLGLLIGAGVVAVGMFVTCIVKLVISLNEVRW